MLASVLYPALSRFPPGQRRGALEKARRTPLDILELVCMAAGLIVGILLMRGGIDSIGETASAWEASSLPSLAAGIGFCMALIAFLLLRRTRRGLRRLLAAERP